MICFPAVKYVPVSHQPVSRTYFSIKEKKKGNVLYSLELLDERKYLKQIDFVSNLQDSYPKDGFVWCFWN